MAKITRNDTGVSAAMKISGGNPGGLSVCAMMLKKGAKIDPDGFAGGIGNLLDMDTLGIYGPHIWMLFKDVAGGNLRVACALLRAWQLGFVSDVKLRFAINNMGEGIDVPALVAQVEERLPRFQREVVAQ